jgi:hypothetical protein
VTTVTERVEAINSAHEAFDWLERHPSTTRAQLGAGRDLLNRVHNLADNNQVRNSLDDLEDIVRGIYGGQPV